LQFPVCWDIAASNSTYLTIDKTQQEIMAPLHVRLTQLCSLFRQCFMMQLSPQEHHEADFTVTSVILQMASLLIFLC